MPRATSKYHFEGKIFEWAFGFSQKMTGENRGFIIIFAPDGAVREIHFGEEEERMPQSVPEAGDSKSWFVYNPFDGPEYTDIGWSNVPQEALERIMGEPFTADDFGPSFPHIRHRQPKPDFKRLEAFPETWDVMF